jgi:hypothetical protein
MGDNERTEAGIHFITDMADQRSCGYKVTYDGRDQTARLDSK